MIQNFEDFCRELNTCGFSMGGGNAKRGVPLACGEAIDADCMQSSFDARA